MTRVFVSGASGFIGGALAEKLIEQGDEVVGLARSDTAAATVAKHGATPIHGDVLDEDSLARAMDGCSLAYHVAALNTHCPPDPQLLLRTNIEGAEAGIRAAARAGVKRVVFTSSAASVGEPEGTIGDENTEHRGTYLSVYDQSKHLGEVAAFRAGAELGVEVVAVNPSSVQGPGRTAGNGKIIIAYLNGKLKAFVDTHVSLVDIQDTVEAHLLAASRGEPGERYVLNGGTITSDEALRILVDLTGVVEKPKIVPPVVAKSAAALAEGVARVRGKTSSVCQARVRTILHGHRYDGSRATRDLGLVYTPVEETFRRTIEWAIAEGLVTRDLPGWRAS